MMRRPPRSTLFPTRRSSDLRAAHFSCCVARRTRGRPPRLTSCSPRSEEHTSELQSLRHLVCRLLLEKKNTPNRKIVANDFDWDSKQHVVGSTPLKCFNVIRM